MRPLNVTGASSCFSFDFGDRNDVPWNTQCATYIAATRLCNETALRHAAGTLAAMHELCQDESTEVCCHGIAHACQLQAG